MYSMKAQLCHHNSNNFTIFDLSIDKSAVPKFITLVVTADKCTK